MEYRDQLLPIRSFSIYLRLFEDAIGESDFRTRSCKSKTDEISSNLRKNEAAAYKPETSLI